MGGILDFSRGHDGGKRQAGTDGFGQGHDIGCHAIAFKGEHIAGAAHARLGLVQNKQHAAFNAFLFKGGQVSLGQGQHAAR